MVVCYPGWLDRKHLGETADFGFHLFAACCVISWKCWLHKHARADILSVLGFAHSK